MATELITLLQTAVEGHGDLPVAAYDSGGCCDPGEYVEVDELEKGSFVRYLKGGKWEAIPALLIGG